MAVQFEAKSIHFMDPYLGWVESDLLAERGHGVIGVGDGKIASHVDGREIPSSPEHEAAPHVVAFEPSNPGEPPVLVLTSAQMAMGFEIGAWIDLPEDNHLDLSGGALVRLKF